MKTQMTIAEARARIVKVYQDSELTLIHSHSRKGTDADAAGYRQTLVEELIRLKLAIQAANLENTVDFDGRRMTIAEALMRKDEMKSEARRLRASDERAHIHRRARLWRDLERLCATIDEANNRVVVHCR